MMNYVSTVFKKYAVFTGRARRAEYWYFYLFTILVGFVISIVAEMIDNSNGIMILATIFWLATVIPSLAVAVRRLHDIGKSGWWVLICLIPIIGWIWLIVLLATDSNPVENKYGPNPKEVKEATIVKE